MCSFLSASINVSLGRHGCKWTGARARSFMFQVYTDTGRPEQECYIFFIIPLWRFALMGLSQIFHTEMLIWAPEGAHPESRSCCPQQSGVGPTVSERRCFKQTE